MSSTRRDHRDEHPGCKVMWPWLRWCSNYRHASQLAGYALEDVASMDPVKLEAKYNLLKRTHKYSSRRSATRDMYIAHRERWSPEEYEEIEDSVRGMFEVLPPDHHFFGGRNFKEEVEHTWFQRQQSRAVAVLYSYGMFNKKTGQIELDRLKKLK